MQNDHKILPIKHLWIGASIKKLQALLWACVKHANMEGLQSQSHIYNCLVVYVCVNHSLTSTWVAWLTTLKLKHQHYVFSLILCSTFFKDFSCFSLSVEPLLVVVVEGLVTYAAVAKTSCLSLDYEHTISRVIYQ